SFRSRSWWSMVPDSPPAGREIAPGGQSRIVMFGVMGRRIYNRKEQSRKDMPGVRHCGEKSELNYKHIRSRSPLNRKGKASNTWIHMRYLESPDSSPIVILVWGRVIVATPDQVSGVFSLPRE